MNTGARFGHINNMNQQNRNWWVLGKNNKIRKHTFAWEMGLGKFKKSTKSLPNTKPGS